MNRTFIAFLILLSFGYHTFAQSSQPTQTQKVAQYLETYFAELRTNPSNMSPLFAGEFVSLPEELAERLRMTFPRHRFTLGQAYLSHWGRGDVPAKILVVTDASTGEVVAHQGELFYFEACSETFYQFLTYYPAASREDARNKVKVLSSLMAASAKEGSVGEVKLKGNTITSDLLLWGKPWRILKVRVGRDNKFSRITMVNAIMKNVVN